uniref:Uncharacterized protein n=1 Tax=Arundo donax TaxID=35708 RepID=A0A0A8XZ28_ARUDO
MGWENYTLGCGASLSIPKCTLYTQSMGPHSGWALGQRPYCPA